MPRSVYSMVQEARGASLRLAQVPREVKDRALRAAAEAILLRQDELLEANRRDLETAKELLAQGRLSKPLVDRLKLDATKIDEIATMIESVAGLDDPVGRTLYAVEMDRGLELYKVTVPFGVIAAIFESRPDALPQIASLCIKSGNSVILKGGSEAAESNRALHRVMKEAFEMILPHGCMQIIEGREAVGDLLTMDGVIDLIIPRGSNEFVRHIQESTRIPVLGHSAGICHIYVDRSADLAMALEVCHDGRVQYPAACNSMKVMLVDRPIAAEFLPKVGARLIASGVRLKGCPDALGILKSAGLEAEPAAESDWSTEYLDLTLPVKVVDGADGAVAHINRYGSKHTDSILAEDRAAARTFLAMVDSSTVIHNASTRFSDGYRYGLGAEVGISTGKIHARGPVGLEGLVTTKYVLMGSGQKVSDYVGKGARRFIHRPLPPGRGWWSQ